MFWKNTYIIKKELETGENEWKLDVASRERNDKYLHQKSIKV